MAGQAFGVIGLEVMGRNIALNIERNGFPIAVYNRTYAKTEHFMQNEARGKNAKAGKTIAEFVQLLERPRRILILVKAGAPVDAVIGELRPVLQPLGVRTPVSISFSAAGVLPKKSSVVVPARQAYSHSASVGNR